MRVSGMGVLNGRLFPILLFPQKNSIPRLPIDTPGIQIALLKMRKNAREKIETWKPLRHKAFEVHLFYQHRTSNDNPNYIIQVGNVFRFIISIESIL